MDEITVAAVNCSKETVHLRGGDLEIEWAEDNNVYMTGPAATAFEGVVEI
ncbi:MAG: hypothetical protein WCV67_02505 [Victivallaceae bacterium]|jgi:diaminopimelate epimerase